jgi:hypothetical protein
MRGGIGGGGRSATFDSSKMKIDSLINFIRGNYFITHKFFQIVFCLVGF